MRLELTYRVQFSCSVMSDSLRTHESQHTRPPCPITNSRSSLRLTSIESVISSSVFPFSSCPQSLPASESFPRSQLFETRWPKYWSFSFSISPSNDKTYNSLTSIQSLWSYFKSSNLMWTPVPPGLSFLSFPCNGFSWTLNLCQLTIPLNNLLYPCPGKLHSALVTAVEKGRK